MQRFDQLDHQGKWHIFAADVGLLWFYQQIWVILRKMHLTCQQERGLTRQNDPKSGFNLGSVLCHLCHFILLAINDEKFIQLYRYTSWGPLMFADLQTHDYYIVFLIVISPQSTQSFTKCTFNLVDLPRLGPLFLLEEVATSLVLQIRWVWTSYHQD